MAAMAHRYMPGRTQTRSLVDGWSLSLVGPFQDRFVILVRAWVCSHLSATGKPRIWTWIMTSCPKLARSKREDWVNFGHGTESSFIASCMDQQRDTSGQWKL